MTDKGDPQLEAALCDALSDFIGKPITPAVVERVKMRLAALALIVPQLIDRENKE